MVRGAGRRERGRPGIQLPEEIGGRPDNGAIAGNLGGGCRRLFCGGRKSTRQPCRSAKEIAFFPLNFVRYSAASASA